MEWPVENRLENILQYLKAISKNIVLKSQVDITISKSQALQILYLVYSITLLNRNIRTSTDPESSQ